MGKYQIEIKWGIIFILVGLLWMVMERLAGLHDVHIDKHMIYTNFFAIPAIIMYVLALREKREKFYQGKISWMQGLISGIMISLVVAILSPLSQWITSEVISPEYFTNIIEYSVDHKTMTREEAEGMFNLVSYIRLNFLFSMGMGIVTSAIVAIFIKKQ
jgi:transcriptional regulator CtsR